MPGVGNLGGSILGRESAACIAALSILAERTIYPLDLAVSLSAKLLAGVFRDRAGLARALHKLRDLGATALSFVCLTHPHADHYRGFKDIIAAYNGKIGNFFLFPWGKLSIVHRD
jgi:glyoxylase-like metal-dependent hydrolase (beta-lactamase superfamily II)